MVEQNAGMPSDGTRSTVIERDAPNGKKQSGRDSLVEWLNRYQVESRLLRHGIFLALAIEIIFFSLSLGLKVAGCCSTLPSSARTTAS